jgi:N-acetylglucosaminyl-diphospho-decaprenol L-rhamnosyltransferase
LSGVAEPRVAVAIVSWNTRDLLARCLESFAAEVERGRAEVWVVDNASEDGSADMVRRRFPWVQLVASGENLGFGRAVNLVAGQTATEWIAPANADIALRDGALDALLAAGDRDVRAGAVAPRLVLPDGSTQHSVFGFPTLPFTVLFATGLFRLSRTVADRIALPGHWDKERARRVPWAVAAFLLVRRGAWDQVGGFDERQWMYAEDLDLGWRLREAGWATRYEPRAHVDHESAAATSQFFGEDLPPHWQRSTYGFIARRRGVGHAWAVALLQVLGTSIRWAYAARRATAEPERYAGERDAYARWVRLHLRAFRSGPTLRGHR